MNRGKRNIRNTMLALHGATILVTGATWLYGSTVHAGTPQWLRSLMSLGLQVVVNHDADPSKQAPEAVNLGELRDFRQISLEGNYDVLVTGAAQYKVSMTPAARKDWKLGVEQNGDGVLRLTGNTDLAGAVLRIETPALERIDAQGMKVITVRGVELPQLALHMKNVESVELQASEVGQWMLHSTTPVSVSVDKATSSRLKLQVSGRISVRYGQ